jgi:thioester reductase-like protein
VPTSPYGSSKLMTEIMLRDAGAAHGRRYMILRYFNVAGADPLGRTGHSTTARYSSRLSAGRASPRPVPGRECLQFRTCERRRPMPGGLKSCPRDDVSAVNAVQGKAICRC